MAYLVLARKYRSNTFDEVVGQEQIAQTLKRAIGSGRIAHAYLFCGTRGVGKTSMARILAKALNCESSPGPTPEPCLKCESCKAIARGDDIDVIEIDAASNTGVENVRDLIANAAFHPARSRFKIYIIDEVHMLSKQAFNALLKTMEEPPAHVKFILATTEPEKVLPTILSRCQRYDFRNIPTREIAGHLANICKQEKIDADEDALLLIAKAGAGSMRDSLSLLDRLLSVGEKKLTVELIESMLGLPRSQMMFELVQAIGEGQIKTTLSSVDRMIQSGLSVDTLIGSLIEHLRNLLIISACGADCDLVELTAASQSTWANQAQKFDVIALTQDIAILEELRRNIKTSQAGRAMLDAALVRLTLAEQFTPIAQMLEESGADGARGAAAGASSGGAGVKKKYDEPVTAAEVEEPVVAVREEEVVEASAASEVAALSVAPAGAFEEEDDDLPAVGKVWEGPSLKELLAAPTRRQPAISRSSQIEEKAVGASGGDGSNVEAVDVKNLPRVWQALLDLLAERGPGVHSLVSHGRLVGIEDGRAIIRYPKRHETFLKMLDRNGKKEAVRDALTKVVGENLGVAFEVDDSLEDSASGGAAVKNVDAAVRAAPVAKAVPPVKREVVVPTEPAANLLKITPELVEELRNSEPLVRELMDSFGAQVVKVEVDSTGGS